MNKTSNGTSIVNARPETPVSCNKKIKKHSLKPQIFLQLELFSPRSCGKTVDPSAVSVLKKNWAKEENDFITHVRLEHCNGLQEETVIRCENSDEENPAALPKIPFNDSITASVHSRKERFQRLAEAAATPTANDDCIDVPKIAQESPTSVMSLKQVVPYPENGRHDQHLQEDVALPALAPAPSAAAVASTTTKDEPGESSSTSPKSTSNDASFFDASDSNLANVFALVNEDEIAPQKHRRSSRRLLLLGCESDDEAERRLEPEPASPVSLGSIKKKKASQSRRRSGMRRSQSCSVLLDAMENAKKDARRSRNQHFSAGEPKNTGEDEAQTSKMTSKVDKSHQRVRSTRSRQSVQELLEGDEMNRPTRSTRRSSQSVMELPTREKSSAPRSPQSAKELLEGHEKSRPTRSSQSVLELPVNQEMTPRRRSSRSSQSVVELPRVHERTRQRRSSRSEQERRGGQGSKKEDVSTGKDTVMIKKPSSSSRRRYKSDEGSLLKKDDCQSEDKKQTRSEEFVVPRGASISGAEKRSRRCSSAKDDHESDDKRQTRSEEFVVPRGASTSGVEERARRRSSSTRTSGSVSTNSSRRGSSSSSSSGSSSGPKRSGTDGARNMKKELVPVTEEHQNTSSSSKKPKMRRRSTSTATRTETKKPN